MDNFTEWLKKEGVEDEVINEFLKTLADKALRTNLGRAATVAGAIALGSSAIKPVLNTIEATPRTPGKISVENGGKPFDREFALKIASMMGIDAQQMSEMSDLEIWNLQMKKVREIENKMSEYKELIYKGYKGIKKVEWPDWYEKFGRYYKWKAPMRPEPTGG